MPLAPFDRHPPRRILLVCTQRIGDVLLATPLTYSLKQAWPQAELHFLVFNGTQSVLEGNPYVDRVIAVPYRTGWRGKLAQLRSLWRRYDLALSTIATDRARLYGWVGGRFRVGFIAEHERGRGKSLLLDRWLPFDDLHTHTVTMGLRLLELLGIPPVYEVVPPMVVPPAAGPDRTALERLAALDGRPYAVLHPSPKFAYKMWRQDAWVELAHFLSQQGLAIILTGGPDRDERAYAKEIARQTNGVNLAGELSLAQIAEIIQQAKLFVGPDTSVTHIAAAVGAPTITLFGPSNPVKWGPWPRSWKHSESPWQWRGGGRQLNVRLIQGPGECVPCRLDGCERHTGSSSLCLQDISADSVIRAAQEMLDDQLGSFKGAFIPLASKAPSHKEVNSPSEKVESEP